MLMKVRQSSSFLFLLPDRSSTQIFLLPINSIVLTSVFIFVELFCLCDCFECLLFYHPCFEGKHCFIYDLYLCG